MLKNMALSLYLVFLFFMLFSFATAAGPFDCDDCVVSKAAFFASSKGLSSGSCGYGPLALNLYGGHVAAALPSVFRNGAGCGACFQISCKHNGLCTKAGTKFVVTDLNTDKTNTTTFVLSSRAFRAMALPGKDRQVLQLGIANVEYKRIPCEYIGQNLAIRVEEFSKPPNYLAIKILYQGGQTEILSGDVGSIAGPFDCDDCVRSKAAFFHSFKGLSSCGYGSLALKLSGGHSAAALPSIYNNGIGCGACFQIRCKHEGLCSKAGAKVVVTDLHTDKSNTTAFVLSSRAFRAMALPGKDGQVLKLGIAHVDYKRIPCVYRRKKLAIRVEDYSNPHFLAIKVLFQGGQTEILTIDVGSVGQLNSPNWKSMTHNYGAVWDTKDVPTGPLQFRIAVISGFDHSFYDTDKILPANWKPGVIYNSTIQIDSIAAHGCNPCGSWK